MKTRGTYLLDTCVYTIRHRPSQHRCGGFLRLYGHPIHHYHLFPVHSDHDIGEHHHDDGVGQGEDGGKHGGFVVKVGDVHFSYEF